MKRMIPVTMPAPRQHYLHYKHEANGSDITIKQEGLEVMGWGFRFYVDTEVAALRAAYIYRFSPHGVRVEYAKSINKWLVTVFNETAAVSGIDGAR